MNKSCRGMVYKRLTAWQPGCCLSGTLDSKLLPRGPEQDFVDVHVFRLTHRERHHMGEGVGGDGDALVELAHALGDVGLGDAVRKLGRDRTG